MPEKVKMSVLGFPAPGLRGSLVRLKPLRAIITSAIVFGLQLAVNAQGNLVNLFDWSNETRFSGSPLNNVQIEASDAANFFGSDSTNNSPCPFAVPELAGSVSTTPGTTYDISFTMQNDFVEGAQAVISFDDFTTNLVLPAARQTSPFQMQYYPVDVELTYAATAGTTDFSFKLPIDDGDAVSLGDFSVIEVPETSTVGIFGIFGCAWLFARRWRKMRPLVPARARCRISQDRRK